MNESHTYMSILEYRDHFGVRALIHGKELYDANLSGEDILEKEKAFAPLGEHLNVLLSIDWEYIENSMTKSAKKAFLGGDRTWDFRKELYGLLLGKGILSSQSLLKVIYYSGEFEPLRLLSQSDSDELAVETNLMRFKNGITDIRNRIQYLRNNASLFNQDPALFQVAARLTFGINMRLPKSTAYERDAYALLAIACRIAEEATLGNVESNATVSLSMFNKATLKTLAHNQAGVDKVREMRSLLFDWLDEFKDESSERKKVLGLLKRSLQIVPPNEKELDTLGSGIKASAITFDIGVVEEDPDTLSIMREMSRYQVGFSEVYNSLADLITASAVKCYESGKKLKVCEICERLFVANASNSVVCNRPYWKRGEAAKAGNATCKQLNISNKRSGNIKQGNIKQEYVPKSKAKLKSDYSQRFKRRAKQAAKQAKAGDIKYLAVLKQFFDYIVDESQHYWSDPNFSSGIIEQWLSESCSILTPSSIEEIYGDGTDCRMPIKSLINDEDSGKPTIVMQENKLQFKVTKSDIVQFKKANEKNVKKWWSGF